MEPTGHPFHIPLPVSTISYLLWATHGSFEDSPHYISAKIVRAEGMRISQRYTGPKKKEVILRILRKAAGSKAPHAAVSGEACGVIS